jgi:hypothetical protein
MRLESDMLIGAVTNLFKSGIACLPLHDAILVGRSHADAAVAAMNHEFWLRTGFRRGIVKVRLRPN